MGIEVHSLPGGPVSPFGPTGPLSPFTPNIPGTPINPCSPFTPVSGKTYKNCSQISMSLIRLSTHCSVIT